MKRAFDDDDDWDSQNDEIDEFAADADDGQTIPCPHCGRSIHLPARRKCG